MIHGINIKRISSNKICIKPTTSFCRLAAKASSSSIRALPALSSSSLSDFICCTKPNPIHLKGEPDPLDFDAFFSNFLDGEFAAWVGWPSGLTCSAMASNALNCFQVHFLLSSRSVKMKKKSNPNLFTYN